MKMTSQTFPLHSVAGQLQYCLFLLLIFTYNPSFSRDPQAVTGLIESVLVIHQPTWDDCQQLLQVLLTTEKKKKNVPGADSRPTQSPDKIEDGTSILQLVGSSSVFIARVQLAGLKKKEGGLQSTPLIC